MLTHDFILVEHVPARIRYTEYDKAAMTRISDEFALAHWQEVFGAVDVYADYCGNLMHGLAYHGTSILTPAMAQALLERVELAGGRGEEQEKLKDLLAEAVRRKGYVIHFGI